MGILLALAFCECSCGSKHEGEETPEVD